VFIELTDQLRCPADHPESFLVLIPDEMEGRRVVRGTLGCPGCHAEYRIEAGVADFQGRAPLSRGAAEPSSRLDAGALLAFLAVEGPGGYVGLVGEACRHAGGLAELLPGVHFALVNPPAGLIAPAASSVVRALRLPFKTRSLRGIVLGQPESAEGHWQVAAVRAVLPGLRAVGEGAEPVLDGFELLGAAEGWWVGRVAS
jgi:uncharacterized protein YbaR (Trm112 family)